MLSVKPRIELLRRTIVEAPANEFTERKNTGVCKKHPGVMLWKRKSYGGIKILNPACPHCELAFCLEIEQNATAVIAASAKPNTTSIRDLSKTIGALAKHYTRLSGELQDQTSSIEALAEEFNRVRSKLDEGKSPSVAISMRRVNGAIADAMDQMEKSFKERDDAIAVNRTYAIDQVKALYENIRDVKKTMIDFQKKNNNKAQEVADRVLQDTLAELNRLALQLDDNKAKWGSDIKQVREDLEFARAHIGSLQVDLSEAKVQLSSQVKEAIRSFSMKSVLLEDRMDKIEARVATNEADIRSLTARVEELEQAQGDRTEIEHLQAQIEELKKTPVVQATAVDVVEPASISSSSPATKRSSPSPKTMMNGHECGEDLHHASAPALVVRRCWYNLGIFNVRSSGPSDVTTKVLGQIQKLQLVHNEKDSVVAETMESLNRCVIACSNDDNALNNEPLQESELAVIVEVMNRRRRRSTASSTASFSNNNDDDHDHHATIQEYGYCSLGNLAVNVTNRDRIARVGGLDVVTTTVLKQYASNENVQWAGFYTIFRLAFYNPTNQAAIMAQYHASSSSSFSSQQEEQEPVVDEEEQDDHDAGDIVDWILETMKARFPNGAYVQYFGCLALGALSQNNPRHAKRIGGSQGGAIEVVLDAMRRFSSSNDDYNRYVVAAGCFALESMVGAIVENQARMKDLLDGGSSLDFVRDERKKLSSAMKSALDSWLSDLDKRFLFPKEDK